MTNPSPPSPNIRFDWQDWLPFFEDTAIPDDQKQELIETLWALVLSFVDLGFDVSAHPENCGENIDLKAVLEAAVLDSKASPANDFNVEADGDGKDAA